MNDYSFRLKGVNGKGVLLIHGLTGAPGEMKFLAKRLHRKGFSVLAPQLAGHCGGYDQLLKSDWRDWLGSVRRGYEELAATVEEVCVAGVCVGGGLGLALAAEQPKVKAAAVYSMTYRYDGWNMKRWYSAIVPFARPFANLPGLRNLGFKEPYPFGIKDEQLRDRVARNSSSVIPGALDRLPLGVMYEMHRFCDQMDRLAPQVRQPSLILHARDDDMSNPRNAYRLRDSLGGPASLHLLDDCYHMIHVDLQRDQVADLTADFFGGEL